MFLEEVKKFLFIFSIVTAVMTFLALLILLIAVLLQHVPLIGIMFATSLFTSFLVYIDSY